MKIYLDTIGCRLNQAEIEKYARQFRASGHILVDSPELADMAVVNTCAVTAAAGADSRQKIRQLHGAGVGELIVTGCWATLRPQEAAALPGVSIIVPNLEKDLLVSNVLQILEEQFDLKPVDRQPIPGARLRTRSFIKVQDGCDNHCTFCVTAIARGSKRSRAIQEILNDILYRSADILEKDQAGADIDGLLVGTTQEIVLTGVHLGSWGTDFAPPMHLKTLVQSILDQTDIPRLRLSSLEPWDLDDEFFTLWENPRLCRHLHLPLQSGSATTLHRMARRTTPDLYSELVTTARRMIPGVAITTDIMTGFPGETEEEFEESLAFVRSMHFAGGHVFPYSVRAETAAARLPMQVPEFIRRERGARMREVIAESTAQYKACFVGQVVTVLWESAVMFEPQRWRLSGLTDNYLRVHAHASRQYWNRITPVHLTGINHVALEGELVT